MTAQSQVPKLYQTVIEDVINSVREAFIDEGKLIGGFVKKSCHGNRERKDHMILGVQKRLFHKSEEKIHTQKK